MKLSRKEILGLRKKKEAVFLITGATGFIGSHTAIELLKRGYRVIMFSRPDRGATAGERIRAMFEWFELDTDEFGANLEIVEGLLDKPDLGISKKTYSYLSTTVDEIIHCAANTSFSEKKRGELETVNIGILKNLSGLINSEKSKCYFFHHISTVYVAGKQKNIFEETLVDTVEFNNVYEETKYRGEQFVSEVFPKKGIRVNIYRSSIVYGDSETGRSTLFNAVYYPVKMAIFLKNTYRNDILRKGGEKAKQMGVRIDEDGGIFLPIRMEKKSGGTINLIPINYYTDAFIAIMENSVDPGIFHIINNSDTTLDDLTGFFSKSFNIKGFRSVSREELKEEPLNALEILFSEYLKMYGPYIRDIRRFDNKISEKILSKRNIKCPEFDLDIFSKCMNYAISVNWKNPWQ